MKFLNSKKRKIKKLLAGGLLAAILAVTFAPASTVMAAEVPVVSTDNTAQETALPAELTSSYFQLASDTVMPRSTTYFIHDQQISFTGSTSLSFNVPSACQARLVIAAIGNEPLYIDVLNGKLQNEHSMVIAPNQSQVQVFNIASGSHYLQFSSITGSQFTVRLQMYTWDY